MVVVDYAWWQVTASQLLSMGFDGVMRYISHDGSKDLSPSERDDLRAHNMTIGLVYESTANRATQGIAAGQADAIYANQHADSLGYPSDKTLWYAVDGDFDPSVVQPYFDGIGSIHGRIYAPYGGIRVIDNVRYPGKGWQTAAWSGGRVSARAGIYQNKFAGNYDSNKVLVADYGQWGAGVLPPVPIPPKPKIFIDEEEEMYTDLKRRLNAGGTPVSYTQDGRTYSYIYDCFSNPDGFVNSFPGNSGVKNVSWLHAMAENNNGAGAKCLVWMAGAGIVNPNPVAGESTFVFNVSDIGTTSWQIQGTYGCARISVASDVELICQIERKLIPA